MNSTPEQLRRVFGAPNAATPEEAARESTRQFVRGRTQISPFDSARNPKGRIISAFEAYKAYGLEVLDEAIEYGSALLLTHHNAVGDALRRQREDLGLDHRAVVLRTKVSVEDLKRIETGQADDVSMAEIERLAFNIGLDEALLAFQPESAGSGIAGRLRTLQSRSPGRGLRTLTSASVVALTEAASVIRAQNQLQDSLGLFGKAETFDPVSQYGDSITPAWKIGYELASTTRRRFDLENNPIPSMREFVEETLGIPVVQTKLPSGIAGATLSIRDSGKMIRGIVLNLAGHNENPLVRRATLAHELGHLLFDPNPYLENVRVDSYIGLDVNPEQPRSVDYVEQRANAFAINFLAPVEAIRGLLDPPVSDDDILTIVSKFGISVTAATFHIENAFYKTYPIPEFDLFIDRDQWRSAEDFAIDYFPIPKTRDIRRGRFSGLVVAAHQNKLLSTSTAASYLNCSDDEFEENAMDIQNVHPVAS